MDTKRSPLSLWGQIKSVLSGEEKTSHEELVPRSRLKQMENRGVAAAESASCCEEQLIDSIASQKQTVSENLLRWTNNPDKLMRQEIRQVHQMGGVAKGFAIDPLADLD